MAQRTVPAADDTRGRREMALACAFEAGQAFRDGQPHTACPYDYAGGDPDERYRAVQWQLAYAGAEGEARADAAASE